MNKIQLFGRITSNLELKATNSGKSYIKFNLAVPKQFKKESDFISCVAWGKTAETISKYLNKGSRIIVLGSLQTGKYTDKNNIVKYTTDVLVENMEFVERKNEVEDTINSSFEEFSEAPLNTETEANPFASYGENVDITLDDNFLE